MQTVGLASFVSGAGVYLVLASSSHFGWSLHRIESPVETRYGRLGQHREHPIVGTITAVYCCEESPYIKGMCTTNRACLTRARWGKIDRSAAQPAEHFLGRTGDIGTCPGGHSAIRCHATGQSAHSSLSLGQTMGNLSPIVDKCSPFMVPHVVYLPPTISLRTR